MRSGALGAAVACAAGLVVASTSGSAGAQQPQQPQPQSPQSDAVALADGYFREGRALMTAGRFADACGKFAASYKLDPAPGTLLNLADCNEKAGRYASAWGQFSNAAGQDSDARRASAIRAHVAELEKHLYRVSIVVEETPNVRVFLDETPLPESSWGTYTPVDPGTHTLRAESPEHRPFSKQFVVPQEPGRAAWTVPTLRWTTESALAKTAEGEDPDRARRMAMYAMGGVTVLGVAVGTITGLNAISKWNSANTTCPGSVCGDAGALDQAKSARSMATLSTLSFVIAGAALTTGVVLFALGPRTTATTTGSTFLLSHQF